MGADARHRQQSQFVYRRIFRDSGVTIDPSDYNQLIKTYLRQLGSNLDTEKAKKVQTMADDLAAELSGKDVSTGSNE